MTDAARRARPASGKRLHDLPSIRRLALRDLDGPTLQALVDHGEDLLVERKRQPSEPPKFGAEVASLANTLGGLVLLGVDDNKAVRGWNPGPRVDLQSHLGALLRKQVDPLPPFVVERFKLQRKVIAVMRVFESTDAPHLVRGTGALYVRTSEGKVPVDDQRMLFELARRGREAQEQALERLQQPLVVRTLQDPEHGMPTTSDELRVLQVTVRVAPLTVAPSYAQWPITQSGADWVSEAASLMTPASARVWAAGIDAPPAELRRQPFPRGVAARSTAKDHWHNGAPIVEGFAVADCAGALGIALRKSTGKGGTIDFAEVATSVIRPAIAQLESGLRRSETYGRAAWRLSIALPNGATIKGQQSGPPWRMSIDGEATVPADDEELDLLTAGWMREYARAAGREEWET